MKRILFLVSLLFFSVPAYAGATISIWPVKVSLWPAKKLDAVHLVNQGNESVKVQIYAKSWDMDENGQFIEADTGDFIFFPRLATIAPNEDKAIRVGYRGVFPATEKPYRLYFEELPPIRQPIPAERGQSELGIQTTLKLSVPLFVRPSANLPAPQLSITATKKTDNSLRVGIHNEGTHNFLLTGGTLELFDSRSRPVFSKEVKVLQRVLPQRHLFVEVPLDNAPCTEAGTLEFKWVLEGQEVPYVKRFPTQRGCIPIIM